MAKRPLNILVFSSLFPHKGEPTLGIFVENRLRHLLADTDLTATVIAPVPWFPFKANIFGKYARAARADAIEMRGGLTIYHPRYLVIPKVGMTLTPYFMVWSAISCVRKLIRKGNKFDLIDAHYLYPDGVAAVKLGAHLNVPVIVTARGSDVTEIALIEAPGKQIKKAVDHADHIITVSENLRCDLISMGADRDKITTLRNGVDLNRFLETDRLKGQQQWGPGPIMLFVGWLIPRKRLDLVLEVTARVPNLKTLIVGDGPLMSQLKAQALAMGITERVVFVGQKNPEEMASIYSAADILLLPSDREGWANVLLEAMACGTPVVSRAIGGAPDLITQDEAGRIVDSDNPKDLADAVNDLLETLPPRKSTRAFAEKFDWKATSAGQFAIFQAAVKSHQKRTDTK